MNETLTSNTSNNVTDKDISLLEYLPIAIKDDNTSTVNNIVRFLDKFEKSLDADSPYNSQLLRDKYLDYNNNDTISVIKDVYGVDNTTLYLIPNLLQRKGNRDSFVLLLKAFDIDSSYIDINSPLATSEDIAALGECGFYIRVSSTHNLAISKANLKDQLKILANDYFNVCNTYKGLQFFDKIETSLSLTNESSKITPTIGQYFDNPLCTRFITSNNYRTNDDNKTLDPTEAIGLYDKLTELPYG